MTNLTIDIGKDERGIDISLDMSVIKNLLIAGCSGSGKSVLLHNIITKLSLLGPENIKFILIDPKRVELTLYKDFPHLLTPTIVDPKTAVQVMKWAVKEIHRRLGIIDNGGYKVTSSYQGESTIINKPYIVIVIDELSDIMQSYPKEAEPLIEKIAELGYKAGVHIILSTSRPNTKVLTNSIRSLIGGRIALQTASVQDSKVIIDTEEAYNLQGHGDMFFQSGTFKYPIHGQINALLEGETVKFIKDQVKKYKSIIEIKADTIDLKDNSASDAFDTDDMFEEVKRAVIEAGKVSTSYIQRKFGLGYSRSAKLIDMLEVGGVIGPANGSKPREVICE